MSSRAPTPVVSPVHIVDAPPYADASVSEMGMQQEHTPDISVDQRRNESVEDAVSIVPTILYNQEPFETVQHNVAELAAKLFRRNQRDIAIHEMKGGSYNRIIGVTISPKPTKFSWGWFLYRCLGARKKKATAQLEPYIVRIPRMQYGGENAADEMANSMKHEVSILKTVGSRLTLPIPKVASYDLTTTNIFERPYMIQTRLPGGNLSLNLWDHLNTQQKQCVAKHITGLAPLIASVEGPVGDISFQNLARSPNSPISVDTFYMAAHDDQPESKPALTCKPLDYLLERCEQWRAYDAAQGVCFDHIWLSFASISKALEIRGFLHGPCVLVHCDLKPYNLLAEVRSETEVTITGVIDWDSAIIAPEFMAYRAPFWLWTPEDMDSDREDEESMANCEPVTDEDKKLKQVFLDNASEKYKMYAFTPEAMLARRMFYILKKGMPGFWEHDEARSVIREWDCLHPEDDVRILDSDFDPHSGSDSDSQSASDAGKVDAVIVVE
jgi:hypothetical protein